MSQLGQTEAKYLFSLKRFFLIDFQYENCKCKDWVQFEYDLRCTSENLHQAFKRYAEVGKRMGHIKKNLPLVMLILRVE